MISLAIMKFDDHLVTHIEVVVNVLVLIGAV